MKKKLSILPVIMGFILLIKMLWLTVVGIDYFLTVWQMRLPKFARKTYGDGSGLRTYSGPGYRVNLRGSFSPEGDAEGSAIIDFYLLGIRVGGSFTTE